MTRAASMNVVVWGVLIFLIRWNPHVAFWVAVANGGVNLLSALILGPAGPQ